MVKKVLIEVNEETWKLLRAQAAEEGRPVKAVVETAWRGYLERPVAGRQGETLEVLSGEGSLAEKTRALAALVNGVRPGAVKVGTAVFEAQQREATPARKKTYQELMREREARRGDESDQTSEYDGPSDF